MARPTMTAEEKREAVGLKLRRCTRCSAVLAQWQAHPSCDPPRAPEQIPASPVVVEAGERADAAVSGVVATAPPGVVPPPPPDLAGDGPPRPRRCRCGATDPALFSPSAFKRCRACSAARLREKRARQGARQPDALCIEDGCGDRVERARASGPPPLRCPRHRDAHVSGVKAGRRRRERAERGLVAPSFRGVRPETRCRSVHGTGARCRRAAGHSDEHRWWVPRTGEHLAWTTTEEPAPTERVQEAAAQRGISISYEWRVAWPDAEPSPVLASEESARMLLDATLRNDGGPGALQNRMVIRGAWESVR